MDRGIDDEIPNRIKDGRRELYFEFLRDFKEYLQDFIRESVHELVIGETLVKDQIELFDGFTRGKVTLKNQGHISIYITTGQTGGFRLDPDEKQDFFVNTQVIATTLSGIGMLGIVKS